MSSTHYFSSRLFAIVALVYAISLTSSANARAEVNPSLAQRAGCHLEHQAGAPFLQKMAEIRTVSTLLDRQSSCAWRF
jgi:hypothetical protein